jgi:TRAP-type C4-dicarboxylate transport system substrate-binding protein
MMAMALTAAPFAHAQDKTVELKISSWVPPAHPLTTALEAWSKSIEAASKGTIKYKVFPAQQLGKAQDHYDMAREGVAEVTFVSPDHQPGRFPVIAAAALPFLASNAKAGSVALDEWYRKYAEKEMKDVKFCLAFTHEPGVFHSKKKIATPNDIKGMKIRPAHAVVASLVTLLGGTNVHSAVADARQILDRGVADAVTFPWGSIVLPAALRHTIFAVNQSRHIRRHVRGTEDGDRRSLQFRVGAQDREPMGRQRNQRPRDACEAGRP